MRLNDAARGLTLGDLLRGHLFDHALDAIRHDFPGDFAHHGITELGNNAADNFIHQRRRQLDRARSNGRGWCGGFFDNRCSFFDDRRSGFDNRLWLSV